jgi:hypothetical protein
VSKLDGNSFEVLWGIWAVFIGACIANEVIRGEIGVFHGFGLFALGGLLGAFFLAFILF